MAQTTKTVEDTLTVTDTPYRIGDPYLPSQGSNVTTTYTLYTGSRLISQGSNVTATYTLNPVILWVID